MWQNCACALKNAIENDKARALKTILLEKIETIQAVNESDSPISQSKLSKTSYETTLSQLKKLASFICVNPHRQFETLFREFS